MNLESAFKKLFLSLSVICSFLILMQKEIGSNQKIEIGMSAPNFTLKSLEGERISLLDFKGKVVLLDFWATWCPPCRFSIPALIKIQKKFKEKNFAVLGINIDENRKLVPRFVRRYKINYPVLYGGGERVMWDYGIRPIPTFFLLDTDGKIAKIYLGFYPNMEEEWEEEITQLLSKRETKE